MPAMTKRSLIKVRDGHVMTLPKGWVEFWNLTKGDKLPIYYDSVLVVVPPNHPHRDEIERKLKEGDLL